MSQKIADPSHAEQFSGPLSFLYDVLVGIVTRINAVIGDFGLWTTETYAAASFTTADGTLWGVEAGDAAVASMRIDRTLWVSFQIRGSDVTGTPSALYLRIPRNLQAVRDMSTLVYIIDAGATGVAGLASVVADGRTIAFRKFSGNFTATTADNTTVLGQIAFEVR